MKKILTIEGMMCGHCTAHVEKVLKTLDGVTDVVVSLQEKTAEVTMNKSISNDVFEAVITEEGYKLTSIEW